MDIHSRGQERTNQIFVQITTYINITSLPRSVKPESPCFHMAVHNSKGLGASTMPESKEAEGFIQAHFINLRSLSQSELGLRSVYILR